MEPGAPQQPQQIIEEKKKPPKALIIILASSGILILIGLFAFILLALTLRKSSPTSSQPTPTPQATRPAPVFTSQKYSYSGIVPPVKNLTHYTLKSEFTENEALIFAKNFGFSEINSRSTDTLYFYNSADPTTGIMAFHLKSGSFAYESYGAIKTTNPSAAKTIQATTYLQKLGFTDATITCDLTYKRENAPDVTFVECHRDWIKLGAPLVSPPGLLNPEDSFRLATSLPGKTTEASPVDNFIYDVSDGANRKARPNDFNTFTLGLYDDGSVHSAYSTLRTVTKTTVNASSELLTPKEALDLFIANKNTFSLAIPAGQGVVNWNRVFPDNKAQAVEADISELTPAYIEKPLTQSQDSYAPYYLIHGRAQLKTGYEVKFVSFVPALKKSHEVLAATTDSEGSIQIGTFDPKTNTPTPTRTQSLVTPTATEALVPTPTTASTPAGPSVYPACVPNLLNGGLSNVTLSIPGYGDLKVATDLDNGYGGRARTYYFVSDQVLKPSPQFNTIRDAFFKGVEEQYVIMIAKERLNKVDWKRTTPVKPNDISAINQARDGKFEVSRSGIGNIPDCNPSDLAFQYGAESCFDKYHADIVATNVQKKIDEMEANPMLMQSASAKPNIFPAISINSLNWVFAYYSVMNRLPLNYQAKAGEQIVCYISGSSPRIFMYGPDTDVLIKTGSKVTYTEAPIFQNTWSGKLKNNIFITKNKLYSSIYYEYDPTHVLFTSSPNSYIVKPSSIGEAIRDISNQLNLNAEERSALLVDAQNALQDIQHSKFVKISVINRHELDKYLPLELTPKPQTLHRIHVLLEPVAISFEMVKPQLHPIERLGFTVVEIGAAVKK